MVDFNYKIGKKWAVSTICRGESDIIELFINWYADKAEIITIALHNPTARILKLIETIKVKNNISNLDVVEFKDNSFDQQKWTNEIYKNVIERNENIEIYAHVDIDEFIFRFDLIEESFEKDLILKLPPLDLVRDLENMEMKWSRRSETGYINNELLSKWDKTIYCLGKNYKRIEFLGGQHDIYSNDPKIVINKQHINFPCIYHIPYRNDIQSWTKFSYRVDNFTKKKIKFENTTAIHIFQRFLDLFSKDYQKNFGSSNINWFQLDIDEHSFFEYSYYLNNKPPEDLFQISDYFYYNYFLKFYNEKNSLLDFIEHDFKLKMDLYNNAAYNDLDTETKSRSKNKRKIFKLNKNI